jgi:hypothetical protein
MTSFAFLLFITSLAFSSIFISSTITA